MSWKALFIITFVVAADAAADEGSLVLDARVAPQFSWLKHPAIEGSETFARPFGDDTFEVFMPRIGFGVRYFLLDSLYVGGAVDGAGALNLVSKEIRFSDIDGDMIVGSYGEVSLPMIAGFRLESGLWFTGAIEIEAGPKLVYWGISALVDPEDLDENGLPAPYPIDVPTGFHVGGVARLNALASARVFENFFIDVGPTIGASWATTWSTDAGLLLRISFAPPMPT